MAGSSIEVQAESWPQGGASKTAFRNLLAQDVRALPLEELEGALDSELDSDVIDFANVPIQLVVRDGIRLSIVKDLAGRKTPHLSSEYVIHAWSTW